MSHWLPPPRTRQIAKWAGLAACAIIVFAWAGSMYGVAWIQYGPIDTPPDVQKAFDEAERESRRHGLSVGRPGEYMRRYKLQGGLLSRRAVQRRDYEPICSIETHFYPLGVSGVSQNRYGFSLSAGLPLVIPFVLLAIPTVALWAYDRRLVEAGRYPRCGCDPNRKNGSPPPRDHITAP